MNHSQRQQKQLSNIKVQKVIQNTKKTDFWPVNLYYYSIETFSLIGERGNKTHTHIER